MHTANNHSLATAEKLIDYHGNQKPKSSISWTRKCSKPEADCAAVVNVQSVEHKLLHLLCLPAWEGLLRSCFDIITIITQSRQRASRNIACDTYSCWPLHLGWPLWSCCTTPEEKKVIFHPWALLVVLSAQGRYNTSCRHPRPTSTWALSMIECFSRKWMSSAEKTVWAAPMILKLTRSSPDWRNCHCPMHDTAGAPGSQQL